MNKSYFLKKFQNLNLILERKMFILFFLIALFRNSLWPSIKIILRSKKENLEIFNKQTIFLKKKSETLFILGGGDSINDISEKQWEEIENSDSLGINRWLIHKHAPTFMLIEGAKQSDIDMGIEANQYNYDLINYSNERCRETVFIFKDLDKLYINFKKLKVIKDRTYLMLKLIIPGKSRHNINRSIKLINKYKILKNIMFPFGARATVCHALSFALLAKYKNIVMCGIDCHGPYFWEKNDVKKLFFLPPKNHPKSLKNHQTVNKSLGDVTADEILNYISKNFKQNIHQKIYINSKKSLLSKNFPVYWSEN